MAFETVSQLVSERYAELQAFLSHIASIERDEPGSGPEEQIVKTLRGMAAVNIYACWEFSVTRSLLQLFSIINDARVPHRHLELVIHSLAMDATFRSVASSPNPKIEKRCEFLLQQISDEIARIDDHVMMMEIQSLKIEVVGRAFRALGINSEPTPSPQYRGLIDEVADSRHAVAHGRRSPAEVGGQLRVADLRRRATAASETSFYIIGQFETLAGEARFVQEAERARFIPA